MRIILAVLCVLFGIAVAAIAMGFVYKFMIIGMTIGYYLAIAIVGIVLVAVVSCTAALVIGSAFSRRN